VTLRKPTIPILTFDMTSSPGGLARLERHASDPPPGDANVPERLGHADLGGKIRAEGELAGESEPVRLATLPGLGVDPAKQLLALRT